MLASYREDLQKQQHGTPIYVGDSVFYVRRYGTANSKKAIKALKLELFGPLHKHEEHDDDLLLAHWLVEYGVSNWEGVAETDGGKPIKYSNAAARKIFLNPEYFQSLNLMLFNESMKFENYLHDQATEDTEAVKKP